MLARNHYRLQISTFWTFFSRIWLHLSIVWKDQQMHLLMFRAWLPYNDSFFQLGILRDDDEVFLVFPWQLVYKETFLASTLLLFSHTYLAICTKPSNDPLNAMLYQVMQYLKWSCIWMWLIEGNFHVSKNGDFSIRNKVKPLRNLFSKECLL